MANTYTDSSNNNSNIQPPAAAASMLDNWMKLFGQGMGNLQARQPDSNGGEAANPMAVFAQMAGSAQAALPHFFIPPQKLQDLQQEYLKQITQLGRSSSADLSRKLSADRRFAGHAWQESEVAAITAALYQANCAALRKMVDITETDEKTRARLEFAVEQWTAATAPTNFMALNPDAQARAIGTHGQSIAQGMLNLWQDLQRGHISMTDEAQFEVGRNIAVTPGAVVFENAYFQLIEYAPSTGQVHQRPLLIVPPCINKYYILDLQPGNSLIEYAVAQGQRCFVISWCNPQESMDTCTWDDYIEHAVLRAIDAVQTISGEQRINALGFCLGGTLLATAMAVLEARGNQPIESATLLTTFVDFSHTGVLDIFIDEDIVKLRELQMGRKGLMSGQDLGAVFSFLKPNELVWNYVVGNYLKGETPAPFDLLYWNSDGTNLPGPFYTWYLRNTYLENNLVKPGRLTVCGEKIDLSRLRVPMYIYGSRSDHIVPVQAAYASTAVFSGSKRFVMGASGHIAGVINPPARGKRSYWHGSGEPQQYPGEFSEWLANAREEPGSWWPDWAQWLENHAGPLVAAPSQPGDGRLYPVIESAPGRYVRQSA